MFTIIGLVIVFAAVLGGFGMGGGPFHVLIQPAELVVIGGAAVGTLFASAPGKMRGRLFATIGKAFGNSSPSREDYLDILKLQYEIFSFMRKNGAVALDEHVGDVAKSSIFSKYPSFLKRHHAVEFFRDALKQIVNGTASPEELDVLLDSELDTHHEENAIPVALLQKTADSLPGLGIVAAVLGIVITMGHLDGGPEEIGHHVAAALIGTFLGILLCYGLLHPIATNAELQEVSSGKYLRCIKEGVVASLKGAAPIVAIEFARKAIFSDERPSSDETDAACRAVKAAAARAAQENPEIAKLKDQVIVQVTDAGLVIEVVDKGRNLLFDLSSADLKPALVGLLRNIAGVLAQMPNRIHVGGHTDSRPFPPGSRMTNWELSFHRADAARRVLEASGLRPGQIERVIAYADSQPLVAENRLADENRRLSILAARREAAPPPACA